MSASVKTRPFTIKFEVGVVTEKDEFGYIAYCPVLKGLTVEGATEEEVKKNFTNAFISYINSVLKHNDPLPICSVFKVSKELKPVIENIDVPIDFFSYNSLVSA